MSATSKPQRPLSVADLTPAMVPGLRELLQAHDFARLEGVPDEDFAVEIDALHRLGLGISVLRRLLFHGLVRRALDPNTPSRARPGRLSLPANSRLFLSATGARLAQMHCDAAPLEAGNGRPQPESTPDEKPFWDEQLGQLFLDGNLVKWFRRPHQVLAQILSAFQQRGWPRRISNPLIGLPANWGKKYLHDALHRLNACQHPPRIRFRGDGRGHGVCWERAG